jgi:hypothetical protein
MPDLCLQTTETSISIWLRRFDRDYLDSKLLDPDPPSERYEDTGAGIFRQCTRFQVPETSFLA